MVIISLYGLVIVAFSWDFLPHFSDCYYDGRRPMSPISDKSNEMITSQSPEEVYDWEDLLRFLTTGAVSPERTHRLFNFIPPYLLYGATLFLQPIVAYNLLSFLYWLLCFLGARGLARAAGASAFGSWLAGTLYGICPYVLFQTTSRGHDKMSLYLLPLLLLALLHAARPGRRPWIPAALAGLLLAAVGLSNQYYLVAVLVFLVLIPGTGLLLTRLRGYTGPLASYRLRPPLLGLAGGGLVLLPFYLHLAAFYWVRGMGWQDPAVSHFTFYQEPGEMVQAWWTNLWLPLVAFLATLAVAGALVNGRRTQPLMSWLAVAMMVSALAMLSGITDMPNGPNWDLPIIWRLKNIYSLVVMPILVFSVLAGLGADVLVRWLQGIARPVVLQVLLALTLATSGFQSHFMAEERLSTRPSLVLPPAMHQFIIQELEQDAPFALECFDTLSKNDRCSLLLHLLAARAEVPLFRDPSLYRIPAIRELYQALVAQPAPAQPPIGPGVVNLCDDWGVMVLAPLRGRLDSAFLERATALQRRGCLTVRRYGDDWALMFAPSNRAFVRCCLRPASGALPAKSGAGDGDPPDAIRDSQGGIERSGSRCRCWRPVQARDDAHTQGSGPDHRPSSPPG